MMTGIGYDQQILNSHACILGTFPCQSFDSLCHMETGTRPTRSQIWILSIARFNLCILNDWRAVAICWAAPPRRPPSGRREKNGGMRGEEHLLFLVLTVAGNVEDVKFISSQGQIWSYNFLEKDRLLHARAWGDLFAVFKNSLSYLTKRWNVWFYNGCTNLFISDIA